MTRRYVYFGQMVLIEAVDLLREQTEKQTEGERERDLSSGRLWLALCRLV